MEGLVGFLQSDDLVLVTGPVMGAVGFRRCGVKVEGACNGGAGVVWG